MKIKDENEIDKQMLSRLAMLKRLVGRTPVHSLAPEFSRAYAKLEFCQYTESIKIRPAIRMVQNAILRGDITRDTIVVESTSGNLGIALSEICKWIGVRFIAVIDPNVSGMKEKLLRLAAYRVVKVTERDDTGGFLLNRLQEVERWKSLSNVYHPNQYKNPDNYLAYSDALAEEIISFAEDLEYLFVSVSTCGTIRGLAERLKAQWPSLKVVGVDIEGSLIFGDETKDRHISGLGSSFKPNPKMVASVDYSVVLSQLEIVEGARSLHSDHNIFAGASSGAAYMALKRVLKGDRNENATAMMICPDGGRDYLETIYDDRWVDCLSNR